MYGFHLFWFNGITKYFGMVFFERGIFLVIIIPSFYVVQLLVFMDFKGSPEDAPKMNFFRNVIAHVS